MHNFFTEFKKFIARGNVMDLAVGLVVGTAFQKIVTSLVNDIIFPSLSPLLNNVSFMEWKLGPVLVGSFIQNIVDFIIVAFCIFLVVKVMNRFKRKEEINPTVEPPRQEQLLCEIRDILKENAKSA